MPHGNDDLYEKRIKELEHSQELSEMLLYEAQKRIKELKQENTAMREKLDRYEYPARTKEFVKMSMERYDELIAAESALLEGDEPLKPVALWDGLG